MPTQRSMFAASMIFSDMNTLCPLIPSGLPSGSADLRPRPAYDLPTAIAGASASAGYQHRFANIVSGLLAKPPTDVEQYRHLCRSALEGRRQSKNTISGLGVVWV